MKKITKILSIMSLLFFVTGCYNYNAKMNIKDDKSMNFTIIETIDTSYEEEEIKNQEGEVDVDIDYGQEMYKEAKTALAPRGYNVEEYMDPENSNLKGIKITKDFKNIDDISKEGEAIRVDIYGITEDDFDDKTFFTVKKGILFNEYTATLVFGNEETTSSIEGFSDISNSFKAKYEVVLPTKVISSNATNISEDKKSLEWVLATDKINTVKYTFKLAEKKDLIMAFASIALIVLLIIIAIVVAINNKKRKNQSIPKLEETKPEEEKVDLMKEPTDTGINIIETPKTIAPLHPTDGPSVVIDAPAVQMVSADGENNILPETVNNNISDSIEPVVSNDFMPETIENNNIPNQPAQEPVSNEPFNPFEANPVSEAPVENNDQSYIEEGINQESISKPVDTSVIVNNEEPIMTEEVKPLNNEINYDFNFDNQTSNEQPQIENPQNLNNVFDGSFDMNTSIEEQPVVSQAEVPSNNQNIINEPNLQSFTEQPVNIDVSNEQPQNENHQFNDAPVIDIQNHESNTFVEPVFINEQQPLQPIELGVTNTVESLSQTEAPVIPIVTSIPEVDPGNESAPEKEYNQTINNNEQTNLNNFVSEPIQKEGQ